MRLDSSINAIQKPKFSGGVLMKYTLTLISKYDSREKDINLQADNAEEAIKTAMTLANGNWNYKQGSIRGRKAA